jgi:hypothetical protein
MNGYIGEQGVPCSLIIRLEDTAGRYGWHPRSEHMGKEQKSNREGKKVAAKTPKEKRAAKKAKKNA